MNTPPTTEGHYWAKIRFSDGRLSKPLVVQVYDGHRFVYSDEPGENAIKIEEIGEWGDRIEPSFGVAPSYWSNPMPRAYYRALMQGGIHEPNLNESPRVAFDPTSLMAQWDGNPQGIMPLSREHLLKLSQEINGNAIETITVSAEWFYSLPPTDISYGDNAAYVANFKIDFSDALMRATVTPKGTLRFVRRESMEWFEAPFEIFLAGIKPVLSRRRICRVTDYSDCGSLSGSFVYEPSTNDS